MEPKKNTKKPLLLIAEDQPVNQKVFSLLLDKLGCAYAIASNGQEALEKIDDREPDLIFMDIQMPVLNGYEATKKLRAKGYKKPIIAVTASDQKGELDSCFDAGMDDVLIKPIKRSDIVVILQKWIGFLNIKIDTLSPVEEDDLITGTVFDIEGMLERFMNNEEVACQLLIRFIERTQGQLESIQIQVDKGDLESAYLDAHTIKGAAFTLGGMALGKIAGRLEMACKNNDQEEMDIAYGLICETFCSFKKAAENYVRGRS